MTVKCVCGDPNMHTSPCVYLVVSCGFVGMVTWIHLMYLDPNTIVDLIQELRNSPGKDDQRNED